MSELILKGIAAAEGIAIGPAFCYVPLILEIPVRQALSPHEEIARFEAARSQAVQELQAIRAELESRADSQTAAIFEAHAMMADDPLLYEAVQKHMLAGQIAEAAVSAATVELSDMLAAMGDDLFAARAADVKDVGRRLLRILLGLQDTSLEGLVEPSIIVAQDLTPSDTARLRPELTLGFCTAAGGLTSHTAILARTLGIPAVVGLGAPAINPIKDQQQLVLDGSAGIIVIAPESTTLGRYRDRQKQERAREVYVREAATQAAVTTEGHTVEVGANIGDVESAREAVLMGAEGVGLLRTEFLYLQEIEPPSEARQIRAYKAIFEAMGDRPVIVRTLDIGGDKPPPYLPFPAEMNPFLGWRAIRICLDEPTLFKTQLRAILRAAEGHRGLIMFPMISSVEELRTAKQMLGEAQAELEEQGLSYAREVPVGIMVETPAAVAVADLLIRECDFFSLGTNDLTQYTLAVDRTNERVAQLFQPLHPAVLRLIKQTLDAAHTHGKWVGMCGELAGMMRAIPILLGLGLDEFSMVPRAIPEAKWLIRRLSLSEARSIADHALALTTSAEIETYMQGVLDKLK